MGSHHLGICHHLILLASGFLALLGFLVILHHHFLLWLLQSIVVLADNADEVCEESIDAACNVESDDNFLLSSQLDEANTVISVHNVVLLVKEHEVNGGPNGDQGYTDNYEETACKQFGPAGLSVFCEEDNGKG